MESRCAISIICCSINPDESEDLRRNIELTIGRAGFEFIVFDNREANLPLAEVYNRCAEQALYDSLCFVHEDVRFLTHDWGRIVLNQLQNEQCGVIGFAGGTLRLKGQNTMFLGSSDRRTHFRRGGSTKIHSVNPQRLDFSPVVTLDGMCLMVSKKVWAATRFDANNFAGFHGYDMDFTIATTVAGFRNYVCNNALIEHRSDGSFSKEWVDSMERIGRKWADELPLSTEPLQTERIGQLEKRARTRFVHVLMSKGLCRQLSFKQLLSIADIRPVDPCAWQLWFDRLKYNSRHKPKQSR
ncbi:MAG: glycosyltransferase [Tidjanibacter sp.]|nr:glycosyltransferase [Tidjanibacter sp.]